MSNNKEVLELLDKHKISEVVSNWAFYRDQRAFDKLKTCFHPDATIQVSFYSGSADGFIQKIKMSKKGNVKHLVGNIRIELKGERAIAESNTTVMLRRRFFDIEADLTCYLRFFDLFEKRDTIWRIADRTGIYEKDNMLPVELSDHLDLRKLESYPPYCRHLCFYLENVQGISGISSFPIVGTDSDAEREIFKKGEEWLAG